MAARTAALGALAAVLPWVVRGYSYEFPVVDLPLQGAVGPDTYRGDSSLTRCSELDARFAPADEMPWNPTVEEAMAFCSARSRCGGFLYVTAAAAAAAGGQATASATYCWPQAWIAGTASFSSAVAFVRQMYSSCDLRVQLSLTVAHYHGTMSVWRRPPIVLDGVEYEVGRDVFILEADAQARSDDGSAHLMLAPSGAVYYMPGSSHATRDQFEPPIALDGYYPLYNSSVAAGAASTRGGGNGLSFELGPTSAGGLPARWSAAPHSQTYHMPTDGVTLYQGDHVFAFALDGYYPLYREQAQAAKASASGTARSHGPGSETGHPLAWSTGEVAMFYMPDGGTQYHGTYLWRGANSVLYDVMRPATTALDSTAAASAAQAVSAAAAARSLATAILPGTSR